MKELWSFGLNSKKLYDKKIEKLLEKFIDPNGYAQ